MELVLYESRVQVVAEVPTLRFSLPHEKIPTIMRRLQVLSCIAGDRIAEKTSDHALYQALDDPYVDQSSGYSCLYKVDQYT